MTLQIPSEFPKAIAPGVHDSVRDGVRFVEGRGKFLAALEVRVRSSFDRVEELRRALWQLRVQVVDQESRSDGDRVVHSFRVVEFDGAPMKQARKAEVLSALRPLLG